MSVFVFLALFVFQAVSGLWPTSWTQQFGDAGSTSYTPFTGPVGQNWKYLGPRASLDAAHPFSPSVDVDGNIFLSLQSRVLAISPQGYVLREYDIQSTYAEYYLEATNTVYSLKYQLILVLASGDTSDHEGGEQLVRLSALDPKSNQILWCKDQNNYEPTNWIAISEKYNLVYVATYSKQGTSIVALSVTTGDTVWTSKSLFKTEWPIFMKVSDDLNLLLIPTLPTGVNDGVLIAINAETGEQMWTKQLGFNEEASFAISSTGVIYGCYGLFPDIAHGKELVILDAKQGTPLYMGKGYCSNASRVLAPSVDNSGNGYYSCGNQIFSVTSNGKLRWRSAVYGYQELPQHIPTSIHPDGTLFYVTINQTSILALSSQDGSLIKSYSKNTEVTINQPPILIGDKYMYIVGLAPHSTAYIYPMER